MKSFDEVVNGEMLGKYAEEIKPEYMPVDENGNIDFAVMGALFGMLDGGRNPNRYIYALIHGHNNLLDRWSTPSKFAGSEERLYKLCLDKGITWEELLDYKSPSEDDLL